MLICEAVFEHCCETKLSVFWANRASRLFPTVIFDIGLCSEPRFSLLLPFVVLFGALRVEDQRIVLLKCSASVL